MWNDLRFAFRTFRRQPVFTAVVLFTLALGIGANTALFGVVNAVLLRDLPYQDAERLYLLRSVTSDGSPTGSVRPPEVRPLMENDNHPVVEVAALAWNQEAQIIGADGRGHLTIRYGVTDQFFDVFKPRMVVGRGFTKDQRPGAVVLAYSTWRDLFGSDPEVVGRTVRLDPGPSQVVGVAPEGFDFPGNAGYWYLMRLGPVFDRIRGYDAYLRIRAGRTPDQIQAYLARLPDEVGPDPATNQRVALVAQPLLEHVVGDLGPTITILFGATAVLLCIACINVANLLLARVTVRARELALREAVGARRWRLVRQLLVESSLLAAMGSVLGLALAAAGIRVLPRIVPEDLPRLDEVTLDAWVLLYTVGTAVLVGLLVGLAPVWRLARNPIRTLMNEAGHGGTSGGGRNRLFAGLVVAEVALSVVLVIGAGLLIRSYANLTATDPGFNPDRMLTFSMNVPGRTRLDMVNTASGKPVPRVTYEPMANFWRELAERVRGLAGVESVATTTSLPLRKIQYDPSATFHFLDRGPLSAENSFTAVVRTVSPGFFQTMQVPIRSGRDFGPSDRRGAPGVAIVNETFARQFFPGENPLGRRIRLREGYTPTDQNFERMVDEMEIIGVVQDVKYTALAEPAAPSVYMSSEQWIFRRLSVTVKTAVEDPETLIPVVRRELETMDPTLAADFALYSPIVRASSARERLGMTLLVSFGIVALILAAVGIHGLLSYSVTQRTDEIAVRAAFGASDGQLVRLVLQRAVGLALAGVILGGIGAVMTRKIVETQLYGVSALDPLVFVAVPFLLLGVALVATWIPMNRIRKVDPGALLRTEH